MEWFDYELEPFTYATPPQQDAMSGFEKFVVTPLDEVEPRALTMEDIDNAWEFLKNQPSRPNLWHESD